MSCARLPAVRAFLRHTRGDSLNDETQSLLARCRKTFLSLQALYSYIDFNPAALLIPTVTSSSGLQLCDLAAHLRDGHDLILSFSTHQERTQIATMSTGAKKRIMKVGLITSTSLLSRSRLTMT